MTKGRTILIWTLSIIIMLFVVIYQRMTGPTYPNKGEKEIYGQLVDYSLPRSNDGTKTVKVSVADETKKLSGFVNFKRYKSYDEWSKIKLIRNDNELYFVIPHQPAAGKILYHLYLSKGNSAFVPLTEQPIILRFRDPVPYWVLVFHLVFIFSTILFSNRAGLEAYFKGNRVKLYTWLTMIALTLGGFVFGPLMQKYAFGAYWTGIPFGYDLTDNKTLFAFVFWLIAMFSMIKRPEKGTWHVIAAIALIVIYLIPHSLFGSEIDYTKTESNIQKIEKIPD